MRGWTQQIPHQRFYREIVAWKYVSHPNVLPFLGVSETLFSFSIISPWLRNGNIVEYIQKHRGVNRLHLLAQAASGLEYLHSLSIVHSDVNPGNILITEEGNARLGDFGITGIITDPTVVEPGSTTTSKPGVVRYMAPELLNPTQFSLANSNPSKESDVYSLAMTAFETLTEILPFGQARDGIIIFHVVTGDRPPRPNDTQWLRDHVWDMLTVCWSEKREQRWGIRAVHDQFSKSSIQEVPNLEPDIGITENPGGVAADHPKDSPPAPSSGKLEEQRKSGSRWRKSRSQTTPTQGTPRDIPPKKRFTFPILPRGRGTTEPVADLGGQGKRRRKDATASRSLRPFRVVVNVLKACLRFKFKKSPTTGGSPPQ